MKVYLLVIHQEAKLIDVTVKKLGKIVESSNVKMDEVGN
jgi:hypothetical protein